MDIWIMSMRMKRGQDNILNYLPHLICLLWLSCDLVKTSHWAESNPMKKNLQLLLLHLCLDASTLRNFPFFFSFKHHTNTQNSSITLHTNSGQFTKTTLNHRWYYYFAFNITIIRQQCHYRRDQTILVFSGWHPRGNLSVIGFTWQKTVAGEKSHLS